MTPRLITILFAAILLLAPEGRAQELLQKLTKQRPQNAVHDYVGVLNQSQRVTLEQQLRDLEQKTGAAIVVVVLQSLDGGQVEDFANQLYEAWGIGQKGKDNGVLFLAALGDRKLRIEVGYGLEGILPDARCGRIRDTYILPQFKAGRHAEGIIAGTVALAQVVATDAGVRFSGKQPQRVTDGREKPKGSPIVSLIIFLIMIPIIIRNPWLLLFMMSSGRGGFHGGGFGGGGFGGFGGGMSGGGGASGSW